MSQQLADRLDSYALRQGDRRGEGMAGRMECNLFHNAYFGHDFVETGIAPAVARKVEDPLGPGHRPVLEQNVVRHFEQPDVYFGTRFAARRTDPQLFIHLLDIFQRKVLHVDIRQAGETAEQKGIPDKL